MEASASIFIYRQSRPCSDSSIRKDKNMGIINFIKENWKLLVVIFGLGGTVTVLGVVPGLEGVKAPVETSLESVKAKLVDPSAVSQTVQ
jgi:hypothetical protein